MTFVVLARALIPTVEAEPCTILMTNRLRTVPVPNLQSFLQNVGRRSFLCSLATFLLVAGQACRRPVQLDPEFHLVLIEQTWRNNVLPELAQPGTQTVHKGDRNPGRASPCTGGRGAIGRVPQLSGNWRENSRRLWSTCHLARNSCRKPTRSEDVHVCTRDRDAFPRADRKQYGEWQVGRPAKPS